MSGDERCWLALVPERPADAWATAQARDPEGGEAGWLTVWRRSSKPVRLALLAWPGAFDPGGAPASVSLLVLPRGLRVIFDDQAVQEARREILAGGRWAAVTSLVRDPSTFGGSLVAARGADAPARVRDDPFAAIAPGLVRRLEMGAGLVGAPAAPAGPVIERYGAAQPWPGDRFAARPPTRGQSLQSNIRGRACRDASSCPPGVRACNPTSAGGRVGMQALTPPCSGRAIASPRDGDPLRGAAPTRR